MLLLHDLACSCDPCMLLIDVDEHYFCCLFFEVFGNEFMCVVLFFVLNFVVAFFLLLRDLACLCMIIAVEVANC